MLFLLVKITIVEELPVHLLKPGSYHLGVTPQEISRALLSVDVILLYGLQPSNHQLGGFKKK